MLGRQFYYIPDAEVVAVLRDHHVRVGHPQHIGAEVEDAVALPGLRIVQMELHLLVAEQEVLGRLVQLQPVHLDVVLDLGD